MKDTLRPTTVKTPVWAYVLNDYLDLRGGLTDSERGWLLSQIRALIENVSEPEEATAFKVGDIYFVVDNNPEPNEVWLVKAARRALIKMTAG